MLATLTENKKMLLIAGVFILLLAGFIALIALYKKPKKESFATQGGALEQLYAKGPEDVYLTTNTEKYVPEFWWGDNPYKYWTFNMPTRYSNYFQPLYNVYPKHYYLQPYMYWM